MCIFNICKRKDGSILMGGILLIAIIIPFFIFAFESATLLILKEKTQNIADNIASASIMELDENWIRIGVIRIDEKNANKLANRIFNESYSFVKKDSLYFDTFDMKVSALNKNGDRFVYNGNEIKYKDSPSLIVVTELKLKDSMIFYKDVKISSLSKSRVYRDGRVIDIIACLLTGRYDDCLKFENR